ncbi:Rho guanine nucleotide exchange factor [Thecaphora frezii]
MSRSHVPPQFPTYDAPSGSFLTSGGGGRGANGHPGYRHTSGEQGGRSGQPYSSTVGSPRSAQLPELPLGNASGDIDGLMEQLSHTIDNMGAHGSNNSNPPYDSSWIGRKVSGSPYHLSREPTRDYNDPSQRQSAYTRPRPVPTHSRHQDSIDQPDSRPHSLSASGIISLYAEDPPSSDSIPARDDSMSRPDIRGYRFPERTPPPDPRVPPPPSVNSSRRHVSRPLPVTPQLGTSVPSGPTSPSTVSLRQRSAQTTPSAPYSIGYSETGTGSEYFGMLHHSASQPTTPRGAPCAASNKSSSFSSKILEASPYRSSASSHETPASIQFHRPLPSTSSQWSDPRPSPNAYDEHLRRNQSFAYGLANNDRSASFNLTKRRPSVPGSYNVHHGSSKEAANGNEVETVGQTHRNPYDLNASGSDFRYAGSTDNGRVLEGGSHRLRTQSEAAALRPSASRSQRQPLPPVPSAHQPTLAAGNTFEVPRSTSTSELYLGRSGSGRSVAGRAPQDSLFDGFEGWATATPTSPRGETHPVARGQVEDVDLSLLSNLAVLLRASVPRGTQIKGSIDYPHSFTGKDVVTTLQNLIPLQLAVSAVVGSDGSSSEQHRKIALLLAKSLKSQLFFHEVDWGENELRDGVEEVYTFLEDSLAGPAGHPSSVVDEDWAAGLTMHEKLDLSLGLPTGPTSDDRPDSKKRMTATAATLELDELPTGVFTPITRCYSSLCSKPGISSEYTCYSASCPNSMRSRLNRIASTGSSEKRAGSKMTGQKGVDQAQKKAWAELVPPELLKSIPASEVARQNAILETIQKEEEFLSDLELLDSLFVKGLQKPSAAGDPPPLPIGPERDAFIAEVFSNHLELTTHIRQLVERLHVRQREENPIVQTIGDIFLSAALDWGQAYTMYLINYPLAISRVKREISVNPRFKAFVETCRRDPAAHKHPLENFLFRPPARLQRYHLHLESILKKTEEGNSDRDNLQSAIDVINDQCKTAQAGVEATEVKVKIREYAYNLASKRNKSAVDLDLLNPQRQLIHQGRVLRKPDAFDFDWTELLAILFDNYFIVTKQKRKEETEDAAAASRFVLAKRPIPVEMLELSGFGDTSISRSIGLSNFHISREREARDFWPFTLSHLGGKVEPLTLFAPSKDARLEWKRKLEEAIRLRLEIQEANKVFEPHTLSDDVFALPGISSIEPDRPVAGADPGAFHGRVTCAVPFTTSDGRRLVAIGCADGVWIGLRNDPRSLRKVLHLKLVTQCAVLESFGIFVVLADKVLISYSLEALVPSASSNTANLRPPQKLSGNRDVLFFKVGVLKDRTLLVYMKKKANESVFRALEPVLNAPRANEGKSGSGFFGKFGKDSKSSDWFRIYKTFFIPSEAYSMQFLRSKLCIVCARGFEIMNLDSLLPGTIPDFAHAPRDDPRILNLQKRVETARPLGMFKTLDGHFLLCYDAFACYVDRLGEPIKLDQIIEWEGFPKDVAFCGRYVLAFDGRFVEVRDTQSGQLVQIIRGSDIRHVSGSGSVSSGATQGEASLASALDADANPVIFVKRQRAHGRVAFDFQAVYELAPTAPPVALTNNPAFARSNTILTASSRSSNAASLGWS